MPTSIPTRLEQLWLREGFLAEVKLVLRLTASAVTSAGQNRARGASWEGQMLMLPRIKEPVYCCTVQISLHPPRCIDLKHNTPTFCVSSLSLSLSLIRLHSMISVCLSKVMYSTTDASQLLLSPNLACRVCGCWETAAAHERPFPFRM